MTTLVYTKDVRVTMEFEVPTRYFVRPTLSTDMVQQILWWERQKRCYGRKRQGPMAKKCCHSNSLIETFFGKEKTKTTEDKRMIKLEFFFKTVLFGHTLINPLHSLFGAQSFLFVHIWFIPSEGPKTL